MRGIWLELFKSQVCVDVAELGTVFGTCRTSKAGATIEKALAFFAQMTEERLSAMRDKLQECHRYIMDLEYWKIPEFGGL